VPHSVLGVVCELPRTRVTAENKLGGSQMCDCEGLTSLNWNFVENHDTLRIRSSVWFTTRTSNCRKQLGGSQMCLCEGFTSMNWYFVENRDTLRIRSSVWFTIRTSNCREQTRRFSKARLWEFNSLNWHLCRIVTHSVSGVVCELLRARVTAENKLSGCQSALLRV